MRDDFFGGLAAFRAITFGEPSAASRLARPALPKLPASFAQALTRATNLRATNSRGLNLRGSNLPLKPYQSPFKRLLANTHPQSAAHHANKPTLIAAQRHGPSSLSSSHPTTTRPLPSAPKPAAPASRTQSAQPPRQTDPSLPAGPLALSGYPHPNGDNGRGMHWVPTTKQSNATVDRFVAEAQRMGVKWVTFLNNGANVSDNDYLVSKLVGAGIQPVMRIYSPTLEPLQGDIEGMVRHFVGLGVHYFQPFNEPNLNVENPDGRVSVDRYLDAWLPAAQAILRGGGLPGFGSMAPGGDFDDQQFLTAALNGLKTRGQLGMLDRAWLSMHNYTWNHPIDDRGDGDGFFKFRAYHSIVQRALDRDLPIIGTEGGTFEGEQEDPLMPAVTPTMAADWTQQAFRYMREKREPWMFASSVWTIANQSAGGSDKHFEAQALFKADGSQSAVVNALQALG